VAPRRRRLSGLTQDRVTPKAIRFRVAAAATGHPLERAAQDVHQVCGHPGLTRSSVPRAGSGRGWGRMLMWPQRPAEGQLGTSRSFRDRSRGRSSAPYYDTRHVPGDAEVVPRKHRGTSDGHIVTSDEARRPRFEDQQLLGGLEAVDFQRARCAVESAVQRRPAAHSPRSVGARGETHGSLSTTGAGGAGSFAGHPP
jgi:hypothetical protein